MKNNEQNSVLAQQALIKVQSEQIEFLTEQVELQKEMTQVYADHSNRLQSQLELTLDLLDESIKLVKQLNESK